MADALYLVSRDEQDQYVRLLNLEESGVIVKMRDTFKVSLGARQAVMSGSEQRRGGAVQVSETRELASVACTFMVKGSTTDAAIDRMESLLTQADSAARERWLWWKPDGGSDVSLYPLVGPAQAQVNYTWPMLMSGFFPVEVTWPAQPWVEGLVQDVSDDFRARDVGAAGVALTAAQQFAQDYTTTVVATSVAQGVLELPVNLAGSTAAKIVRVDRRPFQDGWVTAKGKAKTGSTSAGRVNAPGLRYTPSDGRYIFASLSSSALMVEEYDGAAFQTRATTAQAAPAVGTSFWLRLRAEGASVTAEYWTVEPTPTGSPTSSVTWTDAASVRTGYPVLLARGPGTGTGNTPIIERFDVRPYSWRLQNTPTTINVEQLPGTMDAATDVDLTPTSADSTYPRHVLLGWRRRLSGLANSPLLLAGETFIDTGGGSTTPALGTDATRYRGVSNQAMEIPVLATAGATTIQVNVDPGMLGADDFTDTVTCAVIVRYYRQAGITSPRLAAYMRSQGGVARRYTPEFGSSGRVLPGAAIYFRVTSTTLGTVTMRAQSQIETLHLTLSWAAGSTAAQELAIDEVYLVPLRALVMSATDKARDDGAYSAAFPAGDFTTRFGFRGVGWQASNVSRLLLTPAPIGVGGAQIALPIASEGVELLVRPSASVPDDPVYTTTADILAHNVSVHLRVTPRYRFAA